MDMTAGRKIQLLLIACFVFFNLSCDDEKDKQPAARLQLSGIKLGTYTLDLSNPSKNTAAPTDKPIVASFTASLNKTTVESSVQLTLKSSDALIPLTFAFLENDQTF